MDKKPTHAKPQLYAYYFLDLKEIAREHGYNLVVHGSMNRDLDLIAIPWSDTCADERDLIDSLYKHMTGHVAHEDHWREIYLYSEQPGGRHNFVIQLNRGGYHRDRTGEIADPIKFVEDPQYYIDIAITPRSRVHPFSVEITDEEKYKMAGLWFYETRRETNKTIADLDVYLAGFNACLGLKGGEKI